jgi:ABC-type antimicrobial peptide transport system permease subunit
MSPMVRPPQGEEILFILRIAGAIIGACAIVALLLASVGIYAVIGYGIVQRTREIGIRVALGGTHQQVRNQIIRGGMRLTGAGLVIGVAAALVVARLMQSALFGVSPFSPVVYGGVCCVFGIVALGACWLPSRRAMRVDPVVALREE